MSVSTSRLKFEKDFFVVGRIRIRRTAAPPECRRCGSTLMQAPVNRAEPMALRHHWPCACRLEIMMPALPEPFVLHTEI